MRTQSEGKRVVAALVWSCSGLLLLAAITKLWTATTDLPLLKVADPVLVVNNRYVLMGIGAVELMCVVTLLITRQVWFKGLLLLWLVANFGLYRAALLLSGAGTPCPCLGQIGTRLGLNSSQTELLTKATVVYLLLVGGYLLLRRRPRGTPKEATLGTRFPRLEGSG